MTYFDTMHDSGQTIKFLRRRRERRGGDGIRRRDWERGVLKKGT